MVNFSTIAIIGGLGLLIFFKKDVGSFLNQFKGFGQNFGQDFGKIPDINITIPDFGLPEVFADTGENIDQFGKDVQTNIGEIGKNINQFGIDVQTNIATAFEEAGKNIDLGIKDTQKNFEQFGKDVQTNVGIIGTGITDFGQGITDFFGGLIPAKPTTTVSQSKPSVVTTSRRSGTTTRFGGQSTPKEILPVNTGTGTTTDPFKAQQPDQSAVSPFLKRDLPITQISKLDGTNETIFASGRTTTTGRRFGGRS